MSGVSPRVYVPVGMFGDTQRKYVRGMFRGSMSGRMSYELCQREYVWGLFNLVCHDFPRGSLSWGISYNVYPVYVQRIMSWVCADEKFQVNVIV